MQYMIFTAIIMIFFQLQPVIYMEMQFPGNYPMEPPFVRVVRPRFKFLTGWYSFNDTLANINGNST